MRLREIIYERTVSQDVEAAVHDKHYRMVDDAMEALEWTLAHKPDAGVLRSGRYWLYKQTGFKIHGIPEIVVLYTFSETQVILYAIMFRPG